MLRNIKRCGAFFCVDPHTRFTFCQKQGVVEVFAVLHQHREPSMALLEQAADIGRDADWMTAGSAAKLLQAVGE